MDTPPIYSNANDTTKQCIINLGSSIFSQCFLGLTDDEIFQKYNSMNSDTIVKLHNDEVNHLKRKYNEIKLSHSEELDSETKAIEKRNEKEIERIKKLSSDEIERIKKLSSDEIERIKKLSSDETQLKDERIEFLEKSNETEIERINKQSSNDTQLKDEQIKLLENLMSLFPKQDFKNSNEKGDYAEDWLQNICNKGLPFDPEASMTDTSKVSGSGDGILHIPAYNCRIMIEMKNKTAIDADDLKQFEEHYRRDLDNNKVDLAVLISFSCKNIRTHACCLVHKYDKKDNRVIYYSFSDSITPKEKETKLIDTLQEICLKYEKETNVSHEPIQGHTENIKYIEDKLSDLISHEAFLKKKEKETKKINESFRERIDQTIKKRHTFIQKLCDEGMINKIDQSLLNGSEDILIKKMIDKLKQDMEKHSINLIPKNKNGGRPNWKKKLKEELNLSFEGYESDLFKKVNHTDICD